MAKENMIVDRDFRRRAGRCTDRQKQRRKRSPFFHLHACLPSFPFYKLYYSLYGRFWQCLKRTKRVRAAKA